MAQPPQSRKYLLLAAFAGVAAIILYLVAGNVGDQTGEVREPASAGPPMVAVLPFSFEVLCPLYEQPDCGWDVYIANRDYLVALESLDQPKDGFQGPGISVNDQRRMFTYWLMKDDELLKKELRHWQGQPKNARNDAGDFQPPQPYIELAIQAGVQGNADESEQWIQRWHLQQPIDWAERLVTRAEACRVLGMIAATRTAVDCIREGLAEPSDVTPFLEPYLPFYDSIRHEPEFTEMLADIDGAGPFR